MKRAKKSDGTMALFADETFSRFDNQTWIIRRLIDQLGVIECAGISGGTTNYQTRDERIRNLILDNGLVDTIANPDGNKPETFGQVWRRHSGYEIEKGFTEDHVEAGSARSEVGNID